MPIRFSKLSGAHSAGFGGLKNYATDSYRPNTVLHLVTDGSLNGYSNISPTRDFNNYSRYRFRYAVSGTPSTSKFSPAGNSWSCFFDGTGDYLSIADNAQLEIGASEFCIEAWVCPESYQTVVDGGRYYSTIISKLNSYYFNLEGTATSFTSLNFGSYDGSTLLEASASYSFKIGSWYHVAVTRDSLNQLRLFVNGQLLSTSTDSRTFQNNVNAVQIAATNASRTFFGYLSNVRLLVGTGAAVYTSSFSTSKEPLTAISGTKLLTCASSRFLDISSNNFTVTVNGNVFVKTNSPFFSYQQVNLDYEGFSAYFAGDRVLETPAATSGNGLQLGTSDFTIELWVRAKPQLPVGGASGYKCIISCADGAYYGWKLKQVSGADSPDAEFIIFNANPNTLFAQLSIPNVFNASWNHVAIVRIGNDIFSYLNGSLTDSATIDVAGRNLDYTSKIIIGGSRDSIGTILGAMEGNISNVLIVKKAIYFSSFTPSGTPKTTYPVSESVAASLLTCQSMDILQDSVGAVEDNSPNNHTLTWSTLSDTNTELDGPFFQNDQLSYYFNGSSYLQSADNEAFEIGSGQFTIEAWIRIHAYQTTLDGSGRYSSNICCKNNSYHFYVSSATTTAWETLNFSIITSGGTNVPIQANYSFQNGVWYHVAVSRDSSGIFRGFVNGRMVQETAPTSYLAVNGATTFIVARSTEAGNIRAFNGNISNLRLVKNQALYTSSFDVSKKPLSLLGDTYNTTYRPVSLLTCRGRDFLDQSSFGLGFTNFNNTTISFESPFRKEEESGSSYYFNGSNSSLFIQPAGNDTFSAISFLTQAFTVELWFYALDVSSTSRVLFDHRGVVGSTNHLWANTTTSSTIQVTRGNVLLGTSSAFQLRCWNHLAISRVITGSTSVTYGFLNGVQFFAVTDNPILSYTTPVKPQIGAGLTTSANFFNGYISNFIESTRGLGRYSANFTPVFSKIPQPDSFNVFTPNCLPVVFDSTRKQALRMVGGAITQELAPIGNWTLIYPIYFDGSGDYIEILNSADFDLRDSDFTIETWVKISGSSSVNASGNRTATLFSIRQNSNSYGWSFNIIGDGSTTGTGLSIEHVGATSVTVSQAFSLPQSQWHHIAVSRKDGEIKFFFNGQLQGVGQSFLRNLITENSALTWVGMQNVSTSNQALLGYLYDFRITKGAARYVENFVTPKGRLPIK